MNDYKFGDMVTIDYGKGEQYKGVVFGDTIGYEDGKQDKLTLILSQVSSGICTITKKQEQTINYSFYNETELRKDIIKAMCKECELGLTYVDWHTEDGKCGLTLITEKGKFDLVIEKQKEAKKCNIDGSKCENNHDCSSCSTASYFSDPQSCFD